MFDPTELFSFEPHVDPRTMHADTLLITVGSYTDAGHVQRLIDETVLNALPSHVLGRFDADRLHDYTGHRPQIVFDHDHFTEYERPDLALHHVTDANGTAFLLLSGPEPSFQWERVAQTVNYLIEQFDVSHTVIISGFPAPTPHTRPTFVSQFADKEELRDPSRRLPMSFQMSSSFGGMLSVRLGEANHDMIGLVAHVPQYLTHADNPGSALALIEAVNDTTELVLPVGSLASQSQVANAELDSQVASDEETASIVHQLEAQYDAFMQRRALTPSAEDIPTADEIGAEVEQFLAGLHKPDEGPGELRANGDT